MQEGVDTPFGEWYALKLMVVIPPEQSPAGRPPRGFRRSGAPMHDLLPPTQGSVRNGLLIGLSVWLAVGLLARFFGV